MMVVSLRIVIHIPFSRSLKDKRQVVKGLVSRIRQRFPVSIAEVDDMDLWQRTVLGMAVVSNSSAHGQSILDKALEYMESMPEIQILSVERM